MPSRERRDRKKQKRAVEATLGDGEREGEDEGRDRLVRKGKVYEGEGEEETEVETDTSICPGQQESQDEFPSAERRRPMVTSECFRGTRAEPGLSGSPDG